MVAPRDAVTRSPDRRAALLAAVCALAWLVLMGVGAAIGHAKLVGISSVACFSMLAGAIAAWYLPAGRTYPAIIDGAAAGAMIASACIFLLPMALRVAPVVGSVGIAAGLVAGASLQIGVGGRHGALFEPSVAALTLHSLGAGFVLGLAYGRMPSLGALAGVAIVSHKLPAGYAVAQNLIRGGWSGWSIIVPACAVGLVCLPAAWAVAPGPPGRGALVFGFATGVFVYLATDFVSRRTSAAGAPAWLRYGAVLGGAILVMGLQYLLVD